MRHAPRRWHGITVRYLWRILWMGFGVHRPNHGPKIADINRMSHQLTHNDKHMHTPSHCVSSSFNCTIKVPCENVIYGPVSHHTDIANVLAQLHQHHAVDNLLQRLGASCGRALRARAPRTPASDALLITFTNGGHTGMLDWPGAASPACRTRTLPLKTSF